MDMGISSDYKRLLKNNLCYNNSFGDYNNVSTISTSTSSTNNLAQDTTAPAYNTYYTEKTLTFTDTTAGSEDFHLVASDTDAIGKGADLSGTFTTDIDGTTRTGTWDIGADEYVATSTTNFSRGDYSSRPTDDADLENVYTAGEVTQVGSDDADRVSQSAIVQYAIHQYKNDVGTSTRWSLRWNGQSSMAPSTSKVVLQIYNRDGSTWDTLDEENGVGANTDFDLTATISSDADHYKDANNIICCRVYQNWSQP
jgi:hypothetical protein